MHRVLPVLPELGGLLPGRGLRRGSTVAVGLYARYSIALREDTASSRRLPRPHTPSASAPRAASRLPRWTPPRFDVRHARCLFGSRATISRRRAPFRRVLGRGCPLLFLGAGAPPAVGALAAASASVRVGLFAGLAVGVTRVGDGGGRAGTVVPRCCWRCSPLLPGPGRGVPWSGCPRWGCCAAAESGIALDRLALVPNPGPEWPTVVAALIDGVDVVVVAVPGPVSASIASRLVARARQRGCVLVPYGRWDGADVTLQVTQGRWEGLGDGQGRLRRRKVTVVARGRGAAARPKEITMWMPGVLASPGSPPARAEPGRPMRAPSVRRPAAVCTVGFRPARCRLPGRRSRRGRRGRRAARRGSREWPVRTLLVWCPDWPVVAAEIVDGDARPRARLSCCRANRVVACSEAARAEGVRRGLRRREAQSRCSAADVRGA